MLAVGLQVAVAAWAEPVRVRLEWPAGRGPAAEARITAAPQAAPGDAGQGQQVSARAVSDRATLDLSAGAWTLTAHADGFWSAGAALEVGPGTAPVARLALWPAGRIGGTVSAEGTLPETVALHVKSANVVSGSRDGTLPTVEGVLTCPVTEGHWQCAGPAGTLDLELRAGPFVPVYLWDVLVVAGQETQLGAVHLQRGASVAGWITNADGSLPAEPCQALLGPLAEPEAGSVEASAPAVPVDRRGFFQLAGVPAGEHRLGIECPATRGSRTVLVRAGRETRLAEPLVLEATAFVVSVLPPLDPTGRPWKLNVFLTAAERRQLVDRDPLSAEGRWSRQGFSPGFYDLQLLSHDGAQWLTKNVHWDERSPSADLRVPMLKLSGIVQLGSRPLRARLVFTNDAGTMRLPLESGDDGLFSGYVLASRDALREGWIVDVRSTAPPVTHQLDNVIVPTAPGDEEAWVELTVPMASVRGSVTTEAGQQQAGAQVLAENPASGENYATTADEDGSFELFDLPAGPYRVTAETEQGFSDPQDVEVADGLEPELQLVIRGRQRLRGRLLAAGSPVPGATIQVWLPPGVQREQVSTDAKGRFVVGLPADVSDVGLTIAAPGWPLTMTRVSVPGSDWVEVPLDSAAGSLVLDAPVADAANADETVTVLLAHGGSIESLATVAAWGRFNGGGPEGGRILVPQVEPGTYTLCRVDQREVPTVWSGRFPSDVCRSGRLTGGGMLALGLAGVAVGAAP